MRFIPEAEAAALRAHLDKQLEGPVTLDLFIEPKSTIVVPGQPECELCEETRALLEDVASLSDQITLTVHDVRLNPTWRAKQVSAVSQRWCCAELLAASCVTSGSQQAWSSARCWRILRQCRAGRRR